jgi:hypothetical protein
MRQRAVMREGATFPSALPGSPARFASGLPPDTERHGGKGLLALWRGVGGGQGLTGAGHVGGAPAAPGGAIANRSEENPVSSREIQEAGPGLNIGPDLVPDIGPVLLPG